MLHAYNYELMVMLVHILAANIRISSMDSGPRTGTYCVGNSVNYSCEIRFSFHLFDMESHLP